MATEARTRARAETKQGLRERAAARGRRAAPADAPEAAEAVTREAGGAPAKRRVVRVEKTRVRRATAGWAVKWGAWVEPRALAGLREGERERVRVRETVERERVR